MNKFCLIIILLCITVKSYCYGFDYNGIHYTVLSDINNTVEVSSKTDVYGWSLYSGDIVIPEYVVDSSNKSYKVIAIGENAFRSATDLTSVSLPESIETIKKQSFYSTGKLEEILLNNVSFVGEEAFYGSGIKNLNIPSTVKTIEKDAFSCCLNLTEVTVNPSVGMTIFTHAFYKCNNLIVVKLNNEIVERDYTSSSDNIPSMFGQQVKTYIIGDEVTKIGNAAFTEALYLESIQFPNYLKSMGISCFQGCTSLKNVILPKGISTIPQRAFAQSGLESVIIPSSVMTIGDRAFQCSNLNDVTNLSIQPQKIDNYTFSVHRTLHVLPGYRDIYNKTNYWMNFNIVEDAEDNSSGIEKITDYYDGLNEFYNLSGQKLKQATGIVIIKTSNGSKKMLIK